MVTGDFKKKNSLEKRKEEAERIIERYPDRVPVICERAIGNSIPDIDKVKFLVPKDLTMQHFQYVIRKRIKLTQDQAIFTFVDGDIAPNHELISTVYTERADEDGFLYVTYSGESTLGCFA